MPVRKKKYQFDISMLDSGNEDCLEMVTYDVIERNGYDPIEIDYDVEYVNVRIIGRNPVSGHVFLDEQYEPEKWTCLEDFLDSLRHRFIESLRDELSEIVESRVQTVLQQERATRVVEEYIEIPEKPRVLSSEALVETWLRDTLGFERERPRVSISNIARTRLRASDTDAKKHRVREARAIIKLTRKKK